MKKFEFRPEQEPISIADYRELKSTTNRFRLLPGATVYEQDFSTDVSFSRLTEMEADGIYAHNLFSVEVRMGEVPQVNQHTLSVVLSCYGLGRSVLSPELIYKRGVHIKILHGVVERAWQTTEIPKVVAPPEAQPSVDVPMEVRPLFELHERELMEGGVFGPTEARYLLAELDLIAGMEPV
jgi:hypothetical protein